MTNNRPSPQFHHTPNSIRYKTHRLNLLRELKASIKATHQLNPLLWAVIRGYDNPTTARAKLNTHTDDRFNRHYKRALRDELLHMHGGRYIPTQPEHKALKRRWAKRMNR